jgi:biotin carboxyl carrier protein
LSINYRKRLVSTIFNSSGDKIVYINVKIRKMYSVTVNKDKFAVEKVGDELSVNGCIVDWDLLQIDEHTYHLLKGDVSYMLELVRIDPLEKSLTVKLNNKLASVVIKDRFDLLLEKLGMSATSANPIGNIKAPMPGLILEINVKAGDIIKKGDPVLILEAMKMENVLKSSGDGEIKEVLVDPGSSVEKNQVLIIFK